MAHLLGGQNCLESLAVDISDVHDTITTIFGRVGPVRFPSWKYPDKASCDLEIGKLLGRYCYSKDEDHSKLSHIILFELLVDRLVLLLQALSSFCNQLLSTAENTRPTTAKSVGSAMSVGLVVKKFWNKMAHVYHIVQRELTESRNKDQQMQRLEKKIVEMKKEMSRMQEQIKTNSSQTSPVKGQKKNNTKTKTEAKFVQSDGNSESSSQEDDVSSGVEEAEFKKTCYDVQTQTYDTAFVPCEACSRTQENLITVGKMVMKVCESQGLPSSLAKQKRLLKQSLLAAADVSRWAAEQNRDLSRINDHLDNLYAQIDPLQEKLNRSREKRRTLEDCVKSLEQSFQTEREEAVKLSKELSDKLNAVTQEKHKMEEQSTEEIQELNKQKDFLEVKIDRNEKELKESVTMKVKLESQCMQLTSDLEKEKTETSRLQKINNDLSKTKEILKDMQGNLERTTLELGKMEAKNRTLAQHDQVLQSKHDALLERIDVLDQECEELREKVLDLEGERDDLRDALDETKIQSEKLTRDLSEKQELVDSVNADRQNLSEAIQSFQRDVERLHQELQVNEEKMQMIVQYSADNLDMTSDALDNPQAISREMEKQITSNNIRIAMLEEQNKKLRHSIEKLGGAGEAARAIRQMDEPMLLWNSQVKPSKDKDIPQSDGQRFRKTSDGFRPRPPSSSKLEERENSSQKVQEKRQARALSAKLAHSSKNVASLLRGDSGGAARKVTTPNGVGGRTDYEPVSTFICGACDKMYTTRKDLDIHKAFCYDLQT